MAELKLMHSAGGIIKSHIIFIHGLEGDIKTTWESSTSIPEFWPIWLSEDLEGLAIWSVGYKADKTRWFGGNAMHLVDRGANVLERMLVEPMLQTGEIIFVGHSLGGLVIKQILRVAESQSLQRNEANSFIKRARKVAFLGTPHSGSSLSTFSVFARFFIRPSLATYSLVSGNPNLRDLNNWYRNWAAAHKIEHVILMESELTSLFGPLKAMIVEPVSADPGVFCQAFQVDANHINICKPENKNSEVYVHLRGLILRDGDFHKNTLIENKLDNVEEELTGGFSELSKQLETKSSKTIDSVSKIISKEISEIGSGSAFSGKLFDREIEKELSVLRKSRFFIGYPTIENANKLSKRLIDGDLSSGTPGSRGKALAWCARLLARGEGYEQAKQSIKIAQELGDCEETTIAEAFLAAQENDLTGALTKLMTRPSPLRYSSGFMVIHLYKGAKEAIDWMRESGIDFSDFDTDGKVSIFNALFQQKQWNNALKHSQKIDESEFHVSPALLNFVALSHLLSSVPDDLKKTVCGQIPFNAKSFPLMSDPDSLELRRKAKNYFSLCAEMSREIGCEDVANYAEDYALWLELKDPSTSKNGFKTLEQSMHSSVDVALRRFPLAFDFGVDIDLKAIEREVDRRTARTAGGDFVTAIARFSLTLSKKDHAEVTQYIDRHRAQLEKFINKEMLYLVEIEALVKAGFIAEAEKKLAKIRESDLDESVVDRLSELIAVSQGEDPLVLAISRYEKNMDINELAALVALLEKTPNINQFHDYSEKLFHMTGALIDAERFVEAKNKLGKFSELHQFLKEREYFVEQSYFLKLQWAWSLYRMGEVLACKHQLEAFENDDINVRTLKVNVAISSGDWESLITYIDNEWNERCNRTSEELLQVAHLSKVLQPKRAKDFILLASEKGADDPNILASAYFSATSMGWEAEVTDWMNSAIKLSGDSGPMKSLSMEDLGEMIPEQNEKNSRIWEGLFNGDYPVYIAAKSLNRSLTDFYLIPALFNYKESDVRRRVLIPAFSNVRVPFPLKKKIVSVDPTVLLTLEYIKVLHLFIDACDLLVLPNLTMWWLFNEKQKTEFHQPSKFEEAKKILRLIASGEIKVLASEIISDAELALDVGNELAFLLQECSHTIDGRQKLVVRSNPVHKVNSFMQEEADLTAFSGMICSCSSVVKMLRKCAVLTEEEEKYALDYLSLNEREWPTEVEIEEKAIVYLDSLSVTYLQFTGVLEKIHASGLEFYIYQENADRLKELLNYEEITTSANEHLESIRSLLTSGIASDKVILGNIPDQTEEGQNDDFYLTSELFSAAKKSKSSVIDDRFLNRHKNLALDSGEIPIHTTLDILDYLLEIKSISNEQWMKSRIKLRQSGYAFIPISQIELDYYLDKARIVDGVLIETTELKAIRENLLQLKMGNVVSLPRDAVWLTGLLRDISNSLKGQWLSNLNFDICAARSNWIFQLIDYQGWAHCFDQFPGNDLAKHGAALCSNSLLVISHDLPDSVRDQYWIWLEANVLEPLKLMDPSNYDWLIRSVRQQISEIGKNLSNKELKSGN